jgi:[acyl-carrier-protein] S-malonyltransferase
VIALMFPGQGSQAVGMGRDLYEAHEAARFTYEAAATVLGYDIAQLSFEGPVDKLALTEFTQPALLTHSVATLRVLQENDFSFDLAFGHSLGEYSALVATDALGFDDALRLVKRRGEAMTAAARRQPGAMAAVLGLDAGAVEEICETVADVWPANYNSPGQVVVSGSEAGVEALCATVATAGAKRCLKLNVSGAFHSPLVGAAVDELRPLLEETAFAEPAPPFFSACTVDYEVEDFSLLLQRQIVSPVRFEQSVRRLLGEGYNAFLEVGEGAVLAGLVRRIAPEGVATSVGDPESLERVLAGWPQIDVGGNS